MDYADFYDIAEYGNKNWKGCFTSREIAMNAYDYLCEFKYSKRDGIITKSLRELINLLREDGSEECMHWADRISSNIQERSKYR